MREIKFRAWDKKASIMHPAIDLSAPRATYRYLGNTDLPLMQYTGLKDKNGVEIFEGDIVAVYPHGTVEYNLEDAEVGAVEWDKYDCTYKNIYPSISAWSRHEVIGNIYENSELLEAQA